MVQVIIKEVSKQYWNVERTVYSCGHVVSTTSYKYDDYYHIKEFVNGEKVCECDSVDCYYEEGPDIKLYKKYETIELEEPIIETYNVERECEVCEGMRKVNPVVPRVIVSHGVSAFRKVHSLDGILSRIQAISDTPDMELAASNTNFRKGPVGLIIDTKPIAVFNCDVWSEIDEETGQRCVSDFTRSDYEILDLKHRNKIGKYEHAEYFCTPDIILAVWVKNWYWRNLSLADKKKLSEFCKDNGYYMQFCNSFNDDKPIPGYEEEWL